MPLRAVACRFGTVGRSAFGVHVEERDAEEAAARFEEGLELFPVGVLSGGGAADGTQPGAATLHVMHAVEDVGDDGVAPLARDGRRDDVVRERPSRLLPWGDDLEAVVVDVDADLASGRQVRPVDQGVHERLLDGAPAVAAQVDAPVWGLLPRLARMALDESEPLAQEHEQAAGELGRVDELAFLGPSPPRAKQPRTPDERLVGEQRARVGEGARARGQAERQEVGTAHLFAGPEGIGGLEDRETRAVYGDAGIERVPRPVGPFQDQLVQHLRRGDDALASEPHVGLAPPVCAAVVRRARPGADGDEEEACAPLLTAVQIEEGDGFYPGLDRLGHEVGVGLRVLEPDEVVAAVLDAEHEHAARPVREGADALQPAFGLGALHRGLEVAVRRFRYERTLQGGTSVAQDASWTILQVRVCTTRVH